MRICTDLAQSMGSSLLSSQCPTNQWGPVPCLPRRPLSSLCPQNSQGSPSLCFMSNSRKSELHRTVEMMITLRSWKEMRGGRVPVHAKPLD